VIGTWVGATQAEGVLIARGRVYVTGQTNLGRIYMIDPRTPPGPVVTLSSSLGVFATGITTDGINLWTANESGSISRVDPDSGATNNINAGFMAPEGILFDGANLWVTDQGDNTLKKLDSGGNIIQTVPVGLEPSFPVFDGSNIWVPNRSAHTVTVVRARDGVVLDTLTGNGLSFPAQAAFDGQRVLVTNLGNSLSIWKAADLTRIGTFSTGAGAAPFGACSDGINFWITLAGQNQLARF